MQITINADSYSTLASMADLIYQQDRRLDEQTRSQAQIEADHYEWPEGEVEALVERVRNSTSRVQMRAIADQLQAEAERLADADPDSLMNMMLGATA